MQPNFFAKIKQIVRNQTKTKNGYFTLCVVEKWLFRTIFQQKQKMAVSHFVLLKNGYFAQFGAGYFFVIEDFGKVV